MCKCLQVTFFLFVSQVRQRLTSFLTVRMHDCHQSMKYAEFMTVAGAAAKYYKGTTWNFLEKGSHALNNPLVLSVPQGRRLQFLTSKGVTDVNPRSLAREYMDCSEVCTFGRENNALHSSLQVVRHTDFPGLGSINEETKVPTPMWQLEMTARISRCPWACWIDVWRASGGWTTDAPFLATYLGSFLLQVRISEGMVILLRAQQAIHKYQIVSFSSGAAVRKLRSTIFRLHECSQSA